MRAPIFIIGYPRSGTSFVGKLIATITGYPSHGESHTITLLQELHHQVNLYRKRSDFTGRELVKKLDLQALKDLNTGYFRDFYFSTYGSEHFIDKTPGAVACHGWRVVKDVFPSAVFIACVRSPVEVYESASRKFGGTHEDGSATDPLSIANGWVAAMQGIECLSESEYKTDLHAISQLELRTRPADAVSKLFEFLGIPESAKKKAEELCRISRDDVLTRTIDTSSYKRVSELRLTDSLARQFQGICSPTCKRWDIAL